MNFYFSRTNPRKDPGRASLCVCLLESKSQQMLYISDPCGSLHFLTFLNSANLVKIARTWPGCKWIIHAHQPSKEPALHLRKMPLTGFVQPKHRWTKLTLKCDPGSIKWHRKKFNLPAKQDSVLWKDKAANFVSVHLLHGRGLHCGHLALMFRHVSVGISKMLSHLGAPWTAATPDSLAGVTIYCHCFTLCLTHLDSLTLHCHQHPLLTFYMYKHPFQRIGL